MQLSIVVPVYKSADCLPELARRVQQDVACHFESYELIMVNDNSPDMSWDVIIHLCSEYDFITGVNVRKNVGQDNAIMAGLHCARGEVIVIMDDDLQHDPSDIPSLYKEIHNGFDVVYAYFKEKDQALWKNLGSWFNDRAAVLVLGKPKHIYMSPFKAIRREVVDEIIKYDGPYSYVDGLIFAITSNITQIHATHHSRYAATIKEGHPSGVCPSSNASSMKNEAIINEKREIIPPVIVAIRRGNTEKPVASLSHTRTDFRRL